MFVIVLAAMLAAPPQSTLPPKTKAACACGESCPCRGVAGVPVTFTDGSKGVRFADGTYKLLQSVGSSAQTPTIRNSSESPNSSTGCRIINGQMVCPTPRR